MDTIEKLEIIEEISNLKARYARFADEKRWDDLAQLFTPDGSMEFFDVAGNLTSKRQGREEIQDTIGGNVGSAQPIHHLFSREIEVISPTNARAIWAMEDLIIFPEGDTAKYQMMHGFGHYHETYVNVDGKWFINTVKLTRTRMEFTYAADKEGKK
ncbi:bile-acid 7-alpha-dehydratase [Paenibacillus sp. J23TS9]|uniref:nuclear transport factor 2 family protein n=1 Tax=Paenibacillus sp. J23TS9 TaxID=2807193 RepID=UPI001B0306E6|nr:nuclear transport factor 2 family protein [Paenibacillus sp. J23TS9]GIP26148.1 bile-acid 7-alpha-dehydratase [Paenibacillus sp. J23TS9]